MVRILRRPYAGAVWGRIINSPPGDSSRGTFYCISLFGYMPRPFLRPPYMGVMLFPDLDK